MIKRVHQVAQLRSPLRGIELMSIASNHHFPRHAHDQFGVGVIDGGAQRSWSGIGQVEAALQFRSRLPLVRRVIYIQ